MSPAPRALIFDCDGVLGETERYGHLPAFNAVFTEFGLPVHWTEDSYGYWTAIGGGKERLARLLTQELVEQAGLPTDPDEQQRLIAQWHRRKTEIYIDLVAGGSVLEQAVGPERAARFGVFAGDVVPEKKPAPDIYRLTFEKLGVPERDVVTVEDSATGVKAAVAAGACCVVVTVSSYTADEDFSGAALVVPKPGGRAQPAGGAGVPRGDPAERAAEPCRSRRLLAGDLRG